MNMSETAHLPSAKAFHHRNYRFFWASILTATFATQIISVSVGWQIYDLTRNPLFLGYVGLAQFLPALLLVLVTGLAADKFPRRAIMKVCLAVEILCAASLLAFTWSDTQQIWPIYAVLVTLGIGRAFLGPASSALAPNLVPQEALANALALNGSAWQSANIIGPVAGGLLYGISAATAYGTATFLIFLSFLLVSFITRPPQRTGAEPASLETLMAGFQYIWKQKIVFGAISLDLFAVLMGGAVALMPVYARDILHVGPWGLGLLRSAPGIGAIVVAIVMSQIPIRNHAGLILFGFVAAFGAFTVVFGFSTSVWIAVPALLLMGACDMVSVVIRETLLQLWTPDEVRGRVSAVNSVFVGASNELGEFRAGVVAAKWGTVFAVTVGGFGTIAVAGLWAAMFPQLRRQETIDRRMV